MAKTWFDIETGGLYMDVPGRDYDTDPASPSAVSLSDLLVAESFPLDSNLYDKADTRHWQRDEFIEFGRWVLDVLSESDPSPLLKGSHLKRLYWLGIGPSYARYSRDDGLFKDLEDFRSELNTKPGYARNRFESWTPQDFADWAYTLSNKLSRKPSRKPTLKDYRRYAARSAEFPSPDIIIRHVGSISKLNELIGYPEISKWSSEDYITFGLRVIEVNGMERFKLETIDILGRRRRGPSDQRIRDYFGSWDNYRQVLQERLPAYRRNLHDESLSRQRRLSYYRSQAKQGLLPEGYESLSDRQLLHQASALRLVCDWLPNLSKPIGECIAKISDTQEFVSLLCRAKPGSSLALLQAAAKEMGIAVDIWPPDTRYRHYLRVSDKELEQIRTEKRQKLQKFKNDRLDAQAHLQQGR